MDCDKIVCIANIVCLTHPIADSSLRFIVMLRMLIDGSDITKVKLYIETSFESPVCSIALMVPLAYIYDNLFDQISYYNE